MIRRLFVIALLAVAAGPLAETRATAADPVAPFVAARDAYIQKFRESGQRNDDELAAVERGLRKLVDGSDGEVHVRARVELATVLRLAGRFDEAVAAYVAAAAAADRLGRADLGFDAWIGAARAHAYGARNHGAAAAAIEKAVAAAGPTPNRKQQYQLADYSSQLLGGRGELEAALVNALDAMRLADSDADHFYAELDVGDVLQKFAESCDYRKLIDARSQNDAKDGWGACRRAVGAAEVAYRRAAGTANRLGWTALAEQARGFERNLGPRLFLIDQRAKSELMRESAVFAPKDVRDVLVNQDFAAGGSVLTDNPLLAGLVEQATRDGCERDARTTYLCGIVADMRGDPAAALEYFEQAAGMLATERSGLFDPRRRGTVIENRGEIIRDLALRLLAFGRQADAFVAFESVRSRGLSELAAALAAPDVTDEDRRWLSRLVLLEAKASAIQSKLAENTIATADLTAPEKDLQLLDAIARERSHLLAETSRRKRFAAREDRPTRLADLQQAAKRAGVPVLLYWVTFTNVLVWVVGPEEVDVRTVFLPEGVLADRINRIKASAANPGKSFDETAARELFLYLIAPFESRLSGSQVVIVPQGPLVGLPFEALIDPATGKFLVEQRTIAYAPNAALAVRALDGGAPRARTLTAIVDPVIDAWADETARIEKVPGLTLSYVSAYDLDPEALASLVAKARIVHFLVHGDFDDHDPLLSTLTLRPQQVTQEGRRLTAAELLGLPWRDTELAVLGACESGRVQRRISNEIFGFPWALLVSGVRNVVVSRWRIKGTSNAAWMEHFYKALAGGSSAAKATAAAMRGMIAGGFRHPYHWAAMQVNGS